MTDDLQTQVAPFLDKTDRYVVTIQPLTIGGIEHLRVKQVGDIDSGEILLRREGSKLVLVNADSVVDIDYARPTIRAASGTVCRPSSAPDHDTLFRHMLTQVNVFDSSNGPDHGNLACVWTVRHIAKTALHRTITSTDATAVFGKELKQCYATPFAQGDVPGGGLVISPTKGSNIGHVGFVGVPAPDGRRLIYSNSSARARLEQNFTIDSWIERYKTRKRLEVLFFPLPNQEQAPIG
jgi:hypothetical protein